ncbi:hypothetical protein F5X68DRAFT_262030 [Plectosphaerella plurivora]|uniref:Uncharacterized protein n=1 Tax=Plectosphaerella plurivora TaxID=936078 RepID=A0A9P8VA13_9PEZI|nr:hypothetical protein F5X68DRAFT_262030 [Plectosphaerella plurivora]
MALRHASLRGLLCLCLLGIDAQAALIPSSARQSSSRRNNYLESRETAAGTQCPIADYNSCYQGLPADLCCGPEDSCLVVAANTTAICVPKGTATSPTFMISPITCNIDLQNWTENPYSLVKTIALDSPLGTCGSGTCCPHGFLCSEDDKSAPHCVLDVSVGANRKYRRLRPTSIPIVTEYPDATAGPEIEQVPDGGETETSTTSSSPSQPSATSASEVNRSSNAPENLGTGITSINIPENTDGASADVDGNRSDISIGLAVGVAISAAVTTGLAFFVWLRRKQLFPRRNMPLWADWKNMPRSPSRKKTPLAELHQKDSVPEMAVQAYNTAEMPADAPLCELPSPAASKTLSLPAYVAELPGSPVPDRRASIVPLSSWNTRDASRFERVKIHWYQKRGG